MNAGSVGAPVWRGQRRLFVRRAADQEHAVLYVQDVQDRNGSSSTPPN